MAFILVGSGAQDLSAIHALREGAFDYIASPNNVDELKATVARAIERAALSRTMRELVEDFETTNARLKSFASELQQRVDATTVQLREKVAELDDANRQLAEEQRRREDFIAMVAHDLAGPLTTIDGYVQVLARADVPASVQQRARSIVVSESRRMARLLRDLTETAPQSNNVRFLVEPSRCDLVEIVRQQVELARVRTDRHVIRMEGPSDELIVHADGDRVAQVVSNLLGNAIKHTGGGTIVASLSSLDGMAELRVSDDGPGIAPALLESIFESRARVASGQGGTGAATTGSGLGLYIARGIVEALGGHIWAESDGVHGATFCVTLPTER
jgi:signal transduction histidine kinase